MISRFLLRLVIISSFLLFFSFQWAMAAETDISILIDHAGSQRMLTQRMLRDYVLVGMDVTYNDPKQDLAATVEKFDTQLQEVKQDAVNDKVLAAFVEVEKQWQKVHPVVSAQPHKEDIVTLADNIESLLKKSNDAVNLLQDASGATIAKVVNISGRQRMLSQRMAAFYMLFLWDIAEKDYYVSFQKVVKEFQQAHNILYKSPETTPAIRAELKKASKLFRWFLKVSQKKSNRLTPEVLQRNSDGLLETMQRVTAMYVDK